MQQHMWENHGGKLSGGEVPELKQIWTDLFWQSEAKAKIEADPSILHSKLDHARVSTEGDLYLGMESEHAMNRMVRPAAVPPPPPPRPYPLPPLPSLTRHPSHLSWRTSTRSCAGRRAVTVRSTAATSSGRTCS
jgi:hypothetical protein